ncbi:MAG: protein-disulfide reductase DsbD [Burkholderiales bacterium]
MTISLWPRRVRASLLAACSAALFGSALAAETEYLDPAQAFRGVARVVDAKALEVRIDIAPEYHLYRDRISVELDGTGAQLGKVVVPAGRVVYDANFSKDVEVLEGAVTIPLPVAAASGDFRVRMTYQGCADKGLCYPPQTAFIAAGVSGGQIVKAVWQPEDGNTPAAATPVVASVAPVPAVAPTAAPVSETARVESALKSGSLLTIAGVFLVAGLLLAFTPCVLPMVPILSSIIVGQGAPVSRMRGFTMALAYSLGMAMVYTAFGVVAGLLGEGLAAALQNPWVLGAFALMLATLSLSMFGVFELQMPSFIQSRITETSSRLPGGRFAGVFVMGGLSALIVGPCVAAPLAGALVFISQTKNVVIGGLALFSLAMGMSVPLLLVGVSAGSLLPRAGGWMEGVKSFFGVLLLAVALWIVSPVLPGWALMVILGGGLLVGAVYLKLFDRLDASASGRQRLSQGVALILAVMGTTQVVGALSGGDNPMQPLKHFARGGDGAATTVAKGGDFKRVRSVAELDAALKTAGRPVLLDFYADWCVSCKEMEHLTFSDPAVRARMANALLLQADVTANSPEDKALLKRFGLFGPPGILFFDTRGQERADARVIGFLPAPRFASSLTIAGL